MRIGSAAILVASFLCFACQSNKEGKTGSGEGAPRELAVAEAVARDVPIFAEFVGTLDGNINAEIRARVRGVLETQNYQEGSFVKAGQLLFTIEPKAFQSTLLQARGELNKAKAALRKSEEDVARFAPLVAKNAVSRQELDGARAARDAARAAIESATGVVQKAELDLGYARVVSPIDGIAGIAKVKIGNLVGQSDPTLLTTVSNLDPVRVTFSISEQLYLQHADKLAAAKSAEEAGNGKKLGTPNPGSGDAGAGGGGLELILSNGKVWEHRGRVALADRQIDPSTGTITLQAFFANPNNVLRPGQYAKVRGVKERREHAIVVPQRAVVEMQGTYSVFVVDAQGELESRSVRAGDRVGTFWLIDSGLKEGERVLLEGLQTAKPGMTVVPKVTPPDLSSLEPSNVVLPPAASAGDAAAAERTRAAADNASGK